MRIQILILGFKGLIQKRCKWTKVVKVCKLDWDFVTLNINLGRHNYLFVTNL